MSAPLACTADLDHPCDADDGDPCPSCAAEMIRARGEYDADRNRDARRERETFLGDHCVPDLDPLRNEDRALGKTPFPSWGDR